MIDEFGYFGYTNPSTPKTEEEPPVDVVVPTEINSQAELLRHYATADTFLKYARNAPLNQKAQALNSIVNIIEKISKLQIDLYNAEKFKQFEEALIETLKEFPEVKESFLQKYEFNTKQ